MNEDQAKLKIASAMSGLRPDQRARVLSRVQAQVDEKLAAIREKDVEIVQTKTALRILEGLRPWAKRQDYALERNDCSRLHKLGEAIRAGKVINEDGSMVHKDRQANAAIWENAQPFVVQHDWAAAFKGATDYVDGDFRLPYTHCAFEFRISGRTVIVIAFQIDPGMGTAKVPGPHLGMPYVECAEGYWYFGGEKARDEKVMQYAWEQIRAISVALDAEVASHDVVRAPTALNEKRGKHGEPLLFDFHIVKLRGRAQRLRAPGSGTHRSPRLHFRRGHWRHYETHKTWIRWMLVGDPELGFIDKAYRL